MLKTGQDRIDKRLMVDFFCGAGGFSLGLKAAGFCPLFAFDNDPNACDTYRLNLGNHVDQIEASTLTPELIWKRTGLKKGDVTLVCGGPPCQGFSIQRRGERSDARNDFVEMFGRLAVAMEPTIILMENVPGLLGKRGSQHLDTLTRIFLQSGYHFTTGILDAADFGVAQHRNRAIVVAWNIGMENSFIFPKATHNESSWLTVRDAISDLPPPPEDFSEHPIMSNHTRVAISQLNEERIRYVPPGGGRSDIPEHLQLPCHRKNNGHRHLDVYGRLEWGKPSATITAMFDNFTRGRFAHPDQDRSITAREGARIQSFPDEFRFCGPKKDVARQIGNAVPPALAQKLGEAIISMLEKHGGSRVRQEGELAQTRIPTSQQIGLPLW